MNKCVEKVADDHQSQVPERGSCILMSSWQREGKQIPVEVEENIELPRGDREGREACYLKESLFREMEV